MSGETILSLDGVVRDYILPRESLFRGAPKFRALHGVSLEVRAGESFGIVGESGCGKSTLARAVLALESPSAGKIVFLGEDLFALAPAKMRDMRRHMQMVFQDPYGSLDPRHKVGRIVAEPLDMLETGVSRDARQQRIADLLSRVGLKPVDADKYPHEFSGGQRQRIAIARALITHPKLIVADEPVSALDVSVQAQVLNLMTDLRRDQGLTYLFISHDLSVVRHVTDRVAVMYLGRVVEQGDTAEVFVDPRHPYTRALLDAVPRPDPSRFRHRHKIEGEATVQLDERGAGGGCPFAPRCAGAEDRCRAEEPPLEAKEGGRLAACHFA